MKEVQIQTTQRNYAVLLGNGLLKQAGQRIRAVSAARQAMLVTDDAVAPLYAAVVRESLQTAGFVVQEFVFPHGEGSKTMQTYTLLLEKLAEQQFARSDLLVALGGGVVGDVTGYAAASYLRGIAFVQIPTTLLAMVDSSVGGKTGVNLFAGKNLAGAFWQPDLVLADTATLNTLSDTVYSDGMAEVIKYGMIRDTVLLQKLEEVSPKQVPEALLARCITHKRDIVVQDTFDHGQRQLLNFGHTIGHAVERLSEYRISHGQAVAIGMVVVTRACEYWGLCKSCSAPLRALLQAWDLPIQSPYGAVALADAAASDKKCAGDTITLVIPKRLGECILHPMAHADLAAFLEPGVCE